MKILICSNLTNGIGLQAEYEMLRDFLVKHGHEVIGVQFNDSVPELEAPADLCIWLEVINPSFMHLAKRHWWFCNPEWTKPEYERTIKRHVEKIFAKTHHAYEVLKDKFAGVHYVGFLTRDRMDKSVKRERKFLHIGGNSGFRNTKQVIEAWREYRYWDGIPAEDAPLTVISNSATVDQLDTPGVTFHTRVSEEELVRLQNSHMFHLLPSAYEGFGHALHEAQSVGAILITIDAAPMNEVEPALVVPSIRQNKNNLGILHEVNPGDIREQVNFVLSEKPVNLANVSTLSRLAFEKSNDEFGRLFPPHLEIKDEQQKPVVAILGNHGVSYCTERELDWTFAHMGHKVVEFQENEDTTEDIFKECLDYGVKLFIYVHTHGWHTPGLMTMDELIVKLREVGIITASFHLDRYRGLNIADQREARVGNHAFWRTEYVFTADGGNQDWFREKGVNHFWLPPGVVERDCKLGTFNPDVAIDVGFVGARSYHIEYPFRGELIRFLEDTYGSRFKVFSGFREQSLNDLYASVKVIVGDSCFGGAPHYWSDRVPETLGRGGFLLHPASTGLNIPGLVTYEPGNLTELADKIDYYLAHEDERRALQGVAHNWVKNHETYTNRAKHILKVVGL